MPEPVVFQFQAAGYESVVSAFRSIGGMSTTTAQTVIKNTNLEMQNMQKLKDAVLRARKEMHGESEKQAKKATDEIIKAYQKEVQAAEQAVAAQIKAAEKLKSARLESVKSFAGNFAATAGALAAGTVGMAVRESIKLQEMANRISIASRGYGEKFTDPTQLRKSFEATAAATPGVSAEEVAGGTAAFVSKTGNLKMAQEMQGTFATVASATGSKVEDIANAAADLMQKFDIKTVEDMQSAFAKLTFQGKEGAFELKDAANQFGKLTSAASRFNIGSGQYAVATLGGLTQIARRATGSAESASTSVESMFAQLVKHSPALKGQGVNVFGPGGAARNIQDVLAETITNVGKGNIAQKKMKLEEIFGEQGIRAVSPLISSFETAFAAKKGAGGTEAESLAAGQKAIRDEFDKTINVQSSYTEIQKDAAQAQQDVSAQLTHAWEELKKAAGDTLAPAIVKEVIPALKDLVPAGAGVIKAFAELVPIIKAFVSFISTIPGVKEAFEKQKTAEEEKQTGKEIDDQLQKKIDARLASPEHLKYAVDQDPVLNALYKQQDAEAEKTKIDTQIAEETTKAKKAYGEYLGTSGLKFGKESDIEDIAQNPENDQRSIWDLYMDDQSSQMKEDFRNKMLPLDKAQGKADLNVSNAEQGVKTAENLEKASASLVDAAKAIADAEKNKPLSEGGS